MSLIDFDTGQRRGLRARRNQDIAHRQGVGGTTAGMFAAVRDHPEAHTFIVATEWALVHRLQQEFPDREFVVADGCIGCRLHCPYMKMNDLYGVRRSLVEGVFEVTVDEEDMEGARRSLERMLAVPRDN